MIFLETTADVAGKDFVERVWPNLFAGKRGSRNREYMKVRAFVLQARKPGGASKEWTARILKEYGGQDYRVTTAFEIKVTETNNP